MAIFSKKLPASQEAELRELAGTLREVHRLWGQALFDIHSETRDLYYICCQVLEEDRELKSDEYRPDIPGDNAGMFSEPGMPVETVDTGALIEKAKGAIRTYADFLADTQARVLVRPPADWYPKKHRKAYASWEAYFELTLPNLEAALAALRPPEPLQHDPKGESKLETFVKALNSVAMFSQDTFLSADFALRLEMERLRML